MSAALLVSLLEKNALGQFNTLMSLTLFFLTFMDFGLSQASLREFSQTRTDVISVMKRSVPGRTLILLLTAPAIALCWSFGFITVMEAVLLGTLCVFQFFNFLQSVLLNGLRGYERQTTANRLGALESCAKLAVLLLWQAAFDELNVYTVAAMLLAVKIVFCIPAYTLLPRSAVDAGPVGKSSNEPISLNPVMFDSQVGFLLIALLTALQNRLDWLMVSAMMDAASVATYSVINRYYEIVLFVLGIGFTTLYPWLCRASENNERDGNILRLMRQLQFLPVPLLVILAVFAFPLINTWIWSGRYDDAVTANTWLLPCAGLAVGNMMLYYDLMARGKERLLFKLCAASTLLQAGVNAWAIPKAGIHGAIAGMWLMNFANLLFFSLACYRKIHSVGEIVFTVLTAVVISGLLLSAVLAVPAHLLSVAVILISGAAVAAVWFARDRLLLSVAGS